jgi:putative endonuclease
MLTTLQRGGQWERVAESFLHNRGLQTLHRNYRCRSGEIDLVMLDGATLVFVEVRYRRDDRYGSGAATVTRLKQGRLVSAARHFLGRHARHRQRPCRFDVVSIGGEADRAQLNWIPDAFETG